MVSRSEECVVAGIFDGHCPKNAIGECTIDEQLKDLSEIMKTPLVLEIVYNRTGLVVACSIGLHNASVSGLDESMCVHQCKREIVHKLLVSDTFTRNYDETSTSFAADLHGRCRQTRGSGVLLRDDDYSESELCKERDAENAAKNVLDGIILVDPDMPRELPDFMDESKSPLVLEISYFLGKWQNITYQIGPYTVSADSSIKSPSMHQRKTELWQELIRAFAKVSWVDMVEEYEMNNITTAAQKELIDISQTCNPSTSKPNMSVVPESVTADLPTAINQKEVSAAVPETNSRYQPMRSFNILESAEKYVIDASESLTNATRDTFRQSAKSFYDNLVRAFHANRFHVNKITSSIVSNAIDNPDNCATIVDICCDAIEKASMHSDVTVRQVMSGAFKHGLTQSCRGVLRQAGILLQSKTTGQTSWNADRFEPLRDRTHGACRFMGQMFMKNQMFNMVKEAVHMFMQMNDVNSLECFCVLLNHIKPKLKKIIDDPRRVYDQLKRYSRAGWMGSIRIPQRTLEMIKPLLDVKESNNPTTSTPSTSFYSQRGNFETKRNNTKINHCHYQQKSGDHRAHRTHNSEILQNGQNLPSNTPTMPTQPLNSLLQSDDNRTPLTHNPEILQNGQNLPSNTNTIPTQPQHPLLESDDNHVLHSRNPEILQNGQNPPSNTNTMPTQPLNLLLESDDNHVPRPHNPEILLKGQNPPSSTPTMRTQPLHPLMQSGDNRSHRTRNPNLLRNAQNPPLYPMPTQSLHPILQSNNHHARRTYNTGVLRNGQNPPSNTPTVPSQPLHPLLHSNNHRTRRTHNPGVLRNGQNLPSNTPTVPSQPLHPLLHSNNHRTRRTHNPGVLRNGQNLPSNTPTVPSQPLHPLLHSDNHRARRTSGQRVMWYGQNISHNTRMMPTQHYQGRDNFNAVVYVPRFPRHQ